jgi:hypothetical protein
VHMRMMGQGRAPGVQYQGGADAGKVKTTW